MTQRAPAIQEFLTSLENAFAHISLEPQAAAAIEKISGALRTPGAPGTRAALRLPVCRYLDDALAAPRAASGPMARLADAFAAVEPSFTWVVRSASGPFASANWPEGHANAMIVGPGGLEDRSDLAIGVSLLAPHVRYPDHNHGPEEVYLVLSPGRFQHGDSDWFAPGIGGTRYNEPNIRHAMASDDVPLLALWSLWMGKAA